MTHKSWDITPGPYTRGMKLKKKWKKIYRNGAPQKIKKKYCKSS
jgi:hypothetical protein